MREPVVVMNGWGVAVGGMVGSGEGEGVGANSVRAAATADCSVSVAAGPATGAGSRRLVITRKAEKASRNSPPASNPSRVRRSMRRRTRVGRRGAATGAAAVGSSPARRSGLTTGAGLPAGRSRARANASTDS